MGKVRLLSETVQNKIAAGEVVERPASVVKELVENAIDAGAKNIAVELEGGGHRLIRVSDDGSGMDEEDLVLALERHATSKIADVDDIFRISSLGFRGEALPSIASVSRTAITSGLPGVGEARQIVVEGGKTVRLAPAAPRKGTLVEVRDIFYNTPARRKFLRRPGSENSQSAEFLTRLALAHPELGFRLQVDGLITFSAHPAAGLLERIADIFGKDVAASLIPIKRDVTEGISVEGFISKPPEGGRTAGHIYLMVNKRWIRHPGIARAMADAYKGALPPRYYPRAFINLKVDPQRVDVNVHPTKEEIRFDNEKLVKDGLCAAIVDALRQFAAESGPATASPARPAAPPLRPMNRDDLLSVPLRESRPPQRMRPAESYSGFDAQSMRERIRENIASGRAAEYPRPEPGLADGQAKTPGAPTPDAPISASVTEPQPPKGGLLAESPYRYIGKLFDKFIMLEGKDTLYVIDPHALHERWNFDRLVEAGKRGVEAHRLLLPLEVRLSPAEAAVAMEAAGVMEAFGFAMSLRDARSLEITAAPNYLRPKDVEKLVREVLSDVDAAETAVEARREQLLASLACRASVLLGKSLPEEEVDTLLDRFFNSGQIPTCPHGRPVALALTMEEFIRRFGR